MRRILLVALVLVACAGEPGATTTTVDPRILELQQQVALLQAELASAQADVLRLTADSDALTDEREGLENEVEALGEEIDQMLGYIADLEADLAEWVEYATEIEEVQAANDAAFASEFDRWCAEYEVSLRASAALNSSLDGITFGEYMEMVRDPLLSAGCPVD